MRDHKANSFAQLTTSVNVIKRAAKYYRHYGSTLNSTSNTDCCVSPTIKRYCRNSAHISELGSEPAQRTKKRIPTHGMQSQCINAHFRSFWLNRKWSHDDHCSHYAALSFGLPSQTDVLDPKNEGLRHLRYPNSLHIFCILHCQVFHWLLRGFFHSVIGKENGTMWQSSVRNI